MVSHEQIMALLRRNADYNDMKGSTNGAGYMGGYASDSYGNFPQAIGGCGCCGGAYIGGAYIGGCAMCMGGAKKRGPRHCVAAKMNKLNKLSCAEWKKGHLKKQLTLAQLYAKMNKPKKSSKIEKAMKRMAMADLMVPKVTKGSLKMAKLPPQVEAELAMRGISKSHPIYRECAKYYKRGPKKGRCSKFNILGVSDKQTANGQRLGLMSKLYKYYKMSRPSATKKDLFNDLKGASVKELHDILQNYERQSMPLSEILEI